MKNEPVNVRPILLSDNAAMAGIIRQVMTEMGAGGPGFAIHDPEVDGMYETYSAPASRFFVVTLGDRVVGGGGVAPLAGSDGSVCEVRKMYFLPEARGLGAGKRLLDLIVEEAKQLGFRLCYLETLKTMTTARALYESRGFQRVDKPMGSTGHFGCDAWYVKAL